MTYRPFLRSFVACVPCTALVPASGGAQHTDRGFFTTADLTAPEL